MEEIISLVDKLVKLLEDSKRVKDIFHISERLKEKYKVVLYNVRFTLSDFNSLYDALTSVFNFEYIELINSTEKQRPLNDIVELSRYLALKLSMLESNNRSFYIKKINKCSESWMFIYLKCLLILFLCSSSFEYDYSEENLRIIKKYSIGDLYYRGHSDCSYKIIPSMIRSLGKTQIVDYPVIEKLYDESGLFKKYKSHINSAAVVDYDFCSFVQHATSYSPLIDFTKDKDIALSFATYPNGNLNAYNNTDAALIVLSLKKATNSINIKRIRLDYHDNKLKIDSDIYGKPLYKCSIKDFDTSFALSDTSTNDRMKYQRGVFFCFYRCVIVKGVPLIPWSKGFLITLKIHHTADPKFKIESKKEIYNEIIAKNPEYDFNHLMNPYDYFGEYNK